MCALNSFNRGAPTVSVADVLRRTRPGAKPNSFFDRVGGRPTLDRVHKRFYDKVFEHPWMGQYFAHVEQEVIEMLQSDFMTGQFDGGQVFCGRPPARAHMHLAITAELFDLRHELLKESLIEEDVSEEHRAYWLEADMKFKPMMVRAREDCTPNVATQGILDFPNPNPSPAPALPSSSAPSAVPTGIQAGLRDTQG